jgi:polyisoprenoid-binding protein YceI
MFNNLKKIIKMKKVLFLVSILSVLTLGAQAQKYLTKTGKIKFHSDAPLEKIEAINNQVNAALDVTTGDFVFKVIIKSFEFEKALMQEHFNENYLESAKFPNAQFIGKVTNISEMNFTKNASFDAKVEGTLTMHGVKKPIKATGTLQSKDGKILGKSTFKLKVKDYDIAIPTAVVKNIAEDVEVTVDVTLEKLN